MTPRIGLHYAAGLARLFAALGLLALCVRVLWISVADARQSLPGTASARGPAPEPRPRRAPEGAPTQSQSDGAQGHAEGAPGQGQSEAAPGQLQAPAAGNPALDGAKPRANVEPANARPIPRQIFVDFGPSRSEVFINGRNLGRTPFVGQVVCRTGEEIRIDVVPPEGLPQRRVGICQGTSLRASDR